MRTYLDPVTATLLAYLPGWERFTHGTKHSWHKQRWAVHYYQFLAAVEVTHDGERVGLVYDPTPQDVFNLLREAWVPMAVTS